MEWKESVGYTVWIDWRRQRIYCPARKQSGYRPQLEWEANVAEFVLFLHRETRAPAVPQGSTEISSERALRFYNAKGWLLCNNEPEILEDLEHWKIPRGIPYFFSHCAVAQDLFDLIIELRPLSTPGGLAENIRWSVHEHSLQYLQAAQRPIICLSADNTFKAAGKATVADSSKARSKLVKSTLSFSNEGNEIVAWHFYQSASPAEKPEVLEGFKKCCVELNVDLPEMMVVDNCCQVRNDGIVPP
ncbi:hypothetical protein C8J57DRAFT_1235582 [Mycena rebaudengoi]|nr:hypothetical protein C8J57DRAFT_1235582 [Mycena rebaudengoi]